MIIFYSAVLIAYFIVQFFLVRGLLRLPRLVARKETADDQGNYSVVVAARNETENLPNLLKALGELDYPADKFEIVISDDHSTDKTVDIALGFSDILPNLKIITAGGKDDPGKRSALTRGIAASSYSKILITDADCLPGTGWLKVIDRYFTSECDMLIGPAPLIKRSGFFNGLSCFSNLRSMMLIESTFSHRHPISAIARNLGFRKDAFIGQGGYHSTEGSLGGDDDLLLRNFLDHGFRVNYCDSPAAAVFSETHFAGKDFLRQKARHTQASKFYSKSSKWILALWHMPNLYAQSSVLFLPWFPEVSAVFVIKALFDMSLIMMVQNRHNYSFSPFEAVFYQFFYEIFLIINYFTSRFTKFNWK